MSQNLDYNQVVKVKDRHSRSLLQKPGVTGVGIAAYDPEGFCIVIFIRSKESQQIGNLPTELEGIPIICEVSGDIVAYGSST